MPWPEQTTGRTSGATLLKHVHYRGGFWQTQATTRKRLLFEALVTATPPAPAKAHVPAMPVAVAFAAPLVLLAMAPLAAVAFAAPVPMRGMMAVAPAGLRLPPHALRGHARRKRDGNHHDRYVHDRLDSVRRERAPVTAAHLVLAAPAPMMAATLMAAPLPMMPMAAMLAMAATFVTVALSVLLFLGHVVSFFSSV